MRKYVVTLEDGLEPDAIQALVERLLRIKGVYSVTREPEPVDPNQGSLFADLDAVDDEYRRAS